ncbi:unnamed protein product [Mytilus coruscus]|uniref:PML C-terminal domain-containing protein n=1 Tax=Mytilus coruscus TaxID=42192 RepID=A0A6J8D5T3_MYTCO|nr:unnamed protein product [Mytilus coruscus]
MIVSQANRTAGLSPGVHTSKVSTLRDLQYKKKKAIAITKKAKLRRIDLETERNQDISSCEVREGISYQSGKDMDESRLDPENITEIPPQRTSRIEASPKHDSVTDIFFDIEPTGLSRSSHITQLAAKSPGDSSRFVLPQHQITAKAAEITGLTFENGQLISNGNMLPALLTDHKILSLRMARTVASSGLCLEHLKLTFSRNGSKGIKDLFTEKCGSGVHVTKSEKIKRQVSEFLLNLKSTNCSSVEQ